MNKTLNIRTLAANIVSAFLSRNPASPQEVPTMVTSVMSALDSVGQPVAQPKATVTEATAPKKSNPEHGRNVAVDQYTRAGKLVRSFPSQTIAAQETGIGRTIIVAHLSGKVPHAGGYVFKRAAKKAA